MSCGFVERAVVGDAWLLVLGTRLPALRRVVVYGRPVNHVLHAILTIFTCFAWGFGWAILSSTGGERREVLQVDPYGNIVFSGTTRSL